MASHFLPDPVALDVTSQGDGQPCRLRLILPDGSSLDGQLDAAAFQEQFDALALDTDSGPEPLGKALFEALLPGPMAGMFAAAVKAAGDRGVRLTLELDPALSALHRLPWEQMYYPRAGRWVPLVTAPNIFFSRLLRTGQSWAAPLGSGPLKALVVISSPYPPGNLFVDVAAELERVEEVFKLFPAQITWETLTGPVTVQQLADKLNIPSGYDLLHYIGHGEWDDEEQSGGLILSKTYANGQLGPVNVPAGELVHLFSAVERLPQLIVLAACESGQQSSLDAFAGLGPELVQAGCPAVVCMQAKVEMAVARRFGEGFYRALLDNGYIDWAVNRARAGLLENEYQQWAVPVLYMHLLDGRLFNPSYRFRPDQRQPYKFLSPYTKDDQDLFKGRAKKTDEVLAGILNNPLTIVMGDEGIGLTSLMEAGVRPRLEQQGWWVVTLNEYSNIASEFRVSLEVEGRPLLLKISGDAPLADALKAAGGMGFTHMALLLDQFELALSLPAAERTAIARSLASGFESLGPRLHLVIITHKDMAGELVSFQADLGCQAGAWVDLPPLWIEEAVEAIVEPLKTLKWPVVLDAEFARDRIARDLSALYAESTGGEPDQVDPGQLQITCTWLYNQARLSPQPLISSKLYLDNGGPEGILVRYMRQELATRFADREKQVRQILADMAAPDQSRWVSAASLGGTNGNRAEVESLLEQLVKAELLTRRFRDGSFAYAFACPRVGDEARVLRGEIAGQDYDTGEEVERAWRLWLAEALQAKPGEKSADRALATRRQLAVIAGQAESLKVRPLKALMLLRSAVLRGSDPAPWLNLLRESGGKELVTLLENPPDEKERTVSGDNAARLTGLDDPQRPRRADSAREYGEMAWQAAAGADSIDRRTSALALAALGPEQAVERIQASLADLPSNLRLTRWSEVMGTLADAGISTPAGAAGQRSGVWAWRAFRRIERGWRWIAASALGAGIGAGIGLGTERLLVGLLEQSQRGVIFFALFSYWGFVLAGMMVLLMSLAGPLKIQPASEASGTRGQKFWLGVLGFGLGNLIVAVLNKVSLVNAWPVIPLGFGVGLFASAAFSGVDQSPGRRLLSSGLLAAGMAGAQLLFALIPALGAGISISLSAGYFQVEFDHFSSAAWQSWIGRSGSWHQLLSVLEAALAGLALAYGGLTGRAAARRWQARWQRALERSGDE